MCCISGGIVKEGSCKSMLGEPEQIQAEAGLARPALLAILLAPTGDLLLQFRAALSCNQRE